MDLEILQEQIIDKSIVENQNPNFYYQWMDVREKEALINYRKMGFTPCVDTKIVCLYAEKQEDGSWMRKEFGEPQQLWCCPVEIEKKIRQIRKKIWKERLKPVKKNQEGMGLSSTSERGLGIQNLD